MEADDRNLHRALDRKDPALKVVYRRADELRDDPEQVQIVQAPSLDNDKPHAGLKPVHGLFGSDEWWERIHSRLIRTVHVTGTIRDRAHAGQDSRWGDSVNAFHLEQDDGSVCLESIHAGNKQDREPFRAGARGSCWFALLELKSRPAADGGVNYARTLLEMAVSA
ncbi:hypothetical protein [Tahibacter harae]|uniref:Uncharacterized protein n=1 Tax=Tahibacter harae TaxID=2963937 RepID=A0ABT1QTG0_9GAMM|nr:hypothetical protein [Tahibacter harae]MCQ4165573.1 hypothetical protein [Tahibacter harae]